MIKYEAVYDISVKLGAEAIEYPGTPPYSQEVILKLKDGDFCNLTKLAMIVHIGTHIDTPAHYIAQGKNLDEYPIEKWIRPAHVVDTKDKKAIRPAELEKLDIKPGDALLFKTENSRSGRSVSGVFTEDFVAMSIESADFCVEKKVGLVGIDYNTVDRYGDETFPVHHKLMGGDILILEGINLKDVPAGEYTLFCLPVKIKGVEGSPARAILLR
jgi:arylformamidase